ncbi:MAG: DUF2007 domain-containing protein [Myxococcaceae bacterium]
METARNGHGGGELVRLTTVADNIEASAVRSLLEANGVRCLIQGEQHRSMLGMLGAYIELNVLVAAMDVDRAQQILAERDASPDDGFVEDDDEEEPETAPVSLDPDDEAPRPRTKLKLIALFVLFILLGGPALVTLVLKLLSGLS